ncbi:MAG: ATP-binding protein, partial [Oscillospiraceae bacterium]|nr:ATP-binding protein [Oscillospiraceae bacterium]
MLLEFRAKNYKTFKDELVFSMQPAPKQKGLDYSVLKQRIGKKNHKALCSAVLYGPNASGKTNIIGAMDTFKNIVLRGHIRNSDERRTPNTASSVLELIPNSALEEPL